MRDANSTTLTVHDGGPEVHPTTGYSHCARIGDVLYVSGQVAKNAQDNLVGAGDAGAQARQAFGNLRSVLEANGSSLDGVAKVTVYCTNLEDRPAVNDVRTEVFGSLPAYPASTFVVVDSLADPGWLVEIEAIAAVRSVDARA